MCFSLTSLFPMKAAGLYRAGSKGQDGGSHKLHQLVKSSQEVSLCRELSKNETCSCAPCKNVWWNWDTNMKTARHPLWNERIFFSKTAGLLKNKPAPDVCLSESGPQNQTRRLAQHFCWLEPAVPPSLPPYSPFLSTHHSFFHPFLPLSPSCLPFSYCFVFNSPFLSFSSLSLHFLHANLLPFSPLSSTLSFVSSWKTTEEKGRLGGRASWAWTAVVSYGSPPPSPVNPQF